MLKKLALDIYHDAMKNTEALNADTPVGTFKIPILTTAKDLSQYSDVDLFLEEWLPPAEIRDAFSIVTLLVDALDEVPQELQASTLSFAKQIADKLDSALIVSARPVQVVRNLAEVSSYRLPVVQLLPFQYDQAMRLIDRLVNDEEIVTILREGLANIQSHMTLSPLSVMLLLDIAETEKEIPGTIGEIFEQYMDIALGRHDIDRGIDVVFQFSMKKQFLSELAWFQFYQRKTLSITEAEFDDFLQYYFTQRRFDEDMIPRMKSDIDRSGILRFSSGVYFAHRAFLDFFVAQYIDRHSNEFPEFESWLAELYLSDAWSDATFHYIAHRRELSPRILDEIVNLEEDSLDYHMKKLQVGRLLQAGWLSHQM